MTGSARSARRDPLRLALAGRGQSKALAMSGPLHHIFKPPPLDLLDTVQDSGFLEYGKGVEVSASVIEAIQFEPPGIRALTDRILDDFQNLMVGIDKGTCLALYMDRGGLWEFHRVGLPSVAGNIALVRLRV